jgi:diaminopimelate decarboxylase
MSGTKDRILDDALLARLARENGTPLFVYSAATIRARVSELEGFDVVRYAQKANSNLAILSLLRGEGVLVDAVSAGEVARALRAGFAPEEIVFTADLFDRAAIATLRRHPVPVNLGSAAMIEQYARLEIGDAVTLRVNLGFGHGHDLRVTTGGEHSKHGIWREDLPAAVESARRLGIEVTGLHVHIGSGSDLENLTRASGPMIELAREIGESLGTISAGGGLPIPYRAGEPRFDVGGFASAWRETRDAIRQEIGRDVRLEVEPGRYLVAESGALITEVRATKRQGALRFVLVDAGFHNLVRPALYGAWHEISAIGAKTDARATPAVVAGPLCESADLFTQDGDGRPLPRPLPEVREGDLLCIHDAGAYAASMASNYNSQPFAAEVLVVDGEARLVRRRQTAEDLFRDEILD